MPKKHERYVLALKVCSLKNRIGAMVAGNRVVHQLGYKVEWTKKYTFCIAYKLHFCYNLLQDG